MTEPTPIERRQFGELADDIAYLRRGCGITVAPFEDGFRIGRGSGIEVVGDEGLRKRAEQERDLRARRATERERNESDKKLRDARTVEIVDGAEAAVEPISRRAKKPRAEAPEIEAGPARGAAARAPKSSGGRPAEPVPVDVHTTAGEHPGPPDASPLGATPRVLWLGLELLSVDPAYQREIGGAGIKHINTIAREWHWSLYQPIVVVERPDGTFYIIDGQHRFEAAKRNPLVDQLPCYVVEAPDVSAEARIFTASNTRRLGLTPQQKYCAAKVGDDPIALLVHETVDDLGLTVLKSNPSGGIMPPLSINSPMALIRTLSKYGRAALSTALSLIKEAHPAKENAFRSALIVALGSMSTQKGFSRDRMLAVLKGLDLDRLYEDARLDRITAKGTLETATERVLRAHYDGGNNAVRQ